MATRSNRDGTQVKLFLVYFFGKKHAIMPRKVNIAYLGRFCCFGASVDESAARYVGSIDSFDKNG